MEKIYLVELGCIVPIAEVWKVIDKPMKLCNLFFCFLFSIFCLLASAFATELPEVAVFDFHSEVKSRVEPSVVSTIFREELISTKHFDVMSRGDMEKMFKEQGRFFPECDEKECVIKYAKLLDTQKAIFGTVEPKGANIRIEIEYIDINSSETEYQCFIDYSGKGSDMQELRVKSKELISRLEQGVPLTGKVVKVSGEEVYINVGKVGDKFMADTTEIEVIEVVGDMSQCKVVKGIVPQVEDTVVLVISNQLSVSSKNADNRLPITDNQLPVLTTISGGLWNKETVGFGVPVSSGQIRSVVVGTGRNDRISRIYIASDDHIYEYSYSNKMWNKVEVNSGGSYLYITSLVLANGRNDGIKRLYATCQDNHIYEFSYSGGVWYKADVGSVSHSYLSNSVYSLSVGTGHNDGVMRLYGSYRDGHIYEFSYSNGIWNRVDVGLGSNTIWEDEKNRYGMKFVSVGDGRSDGITRVYGACWDDYVYEFTYSNGVWNKKDIAKMPNIIQSLSVGNGRGDNKTGVYVSCFDKYLYEFAYSNGVWNKVHIGSGIPGFLTLQDIESVSISNGRNDGMMRTYGLSDNHILEFTYSEGAWYRTDIGKTENHFNSIFVGNGRNDGVMRVYGACSDNYLYEFTYSKEETQKAVGGNW
jgi:hypothetical protein